VINSEAINYQICYNCGCGYLLDRT